MFENRGRGIGDKGKDNGLLVLLAVKDRRVRVEVGYDLEQFVTDGYAGEVSRTDMAPYFARGEYGAGLQAGVTRIIGRIAQGRGVTLTDVPMPAPERTTGIPVSPWLIIAIIIIIMLMNSAGGRRSRMRRGGSMGRRRVERLEQRRRPVRRRRPHRRRRIWRRLWRIRRRTKRRWRRRRGLVEVESFHGNLYATLCSAGGSRGGTLLSGCSYNRFVSQEEAVKAQWAQVQNQLQRRNDLIPNLVETVKGYASHEKEVFQQIAESRAKLSGAQTPADAIAAANQQSAALARLLVIVEAYPNLKANEQFNRLSDELAGTENRIAVERMRYNERVQEYNTSRRQFPGVVTAKIFGFKDYPLFEAPPAAQQVPKVTF